ncbi:glutaredoxin family protein [Thauera sp. ZXT1-4]|uniref:glutaredoxin family protein n=1 Tax=Thauera sp. ZXT1-4 TaxID=3460294 RepID=UPI00404075C5
MSAAMRQVGMAAALGRVLVFLALFFPLPVWASGDAEAASPLVLPPPGELQVFVRDGCPHCADAKTYLDELQRIRPDLRIVLRQVDRDPAARDVLVAISQAVGAWPPGVPTFVYGTQVLVGFDDAAHTGSELERLIEALPPPPRDRFESALFGTLSVSELGLPLFTLALGLLDGFNPCAMWVLLFLLSLLVRLKDRRRMALVAGTFVLASGAVYYAFMAAWLNVFLFVGMTDALRIGLAALAMLIGLVNVKDFFAFRRGVSLSIPESAKPGIYARVRAILKARSLSASLVAVAVLAVGVNFVELLCTAGLPAIYTAVLTQHALSPQAHYGYLALYIFAYIADDALMVGTAVLALGSGKLTERGGRVLKLLSGAVMLALGTVMLLRPAWLM